VCGAVGIVPPVSERFGPFILERLLGRGGMAEAFIAQRRGAAGPRLVLKRIRADLADDAEYLRRFILEAQVASRLGHDNLVRFHEFGRVGRCHYIAMDMVTGHSLNRLLDPVFADDRAPPVAAGLSIGTGLLDGLAAMHAVTDENGEPRPMLHRDVTPANVIISRDGVPVIIDFGITKDVLGPAITLPGRVIGTARYMAPEHRMAEYIDTRADVFSVSVILFELLTGTHPWPPLDSIKELLRTSFDPPVFPASAVERLPEDIRAVLLKGLACAPQDRFADAAAMADALRACTDYAALVDGGRQSVVEWVRSLDVTLDEELSAPVVDLARREPEEEVVMWTAGGNLSTDEVSAFDPTVDDHGVLTIPPLPPRRDAVLAMSGTEDLSLEALPGRPMWFWPAVLAVSAVAVWVVLSLFR
jgi:serine/threonine protein kinase